MINLLTPFVIQRSFATKDLVYIYVYTYYCVTEILRFALNDNMEKWMFPRSFASLWMTIEINPVSYSYLCVFSPYRCQSPSPAHAGGCLPP